MLWGTSSRQAGRRCGSIGADGNEPAAKDAGVSSLRIGDVCMTPDGPGRYMGFAFTTWEGRRIHCAVLEGGEFITYEEA